MSAAKVWGAVWTLHPALGYRSDVDWDAALVAAVPAILEADDTAAYGRALGAMLAVLEDPVTRILPPATEERHVPNAEVNATHALLEGDTLLLRAGDPYRIAGAAGQEAIAATLEQLPRARLLVLDLRSPVATEEYARFQVLSSLGPLLRKVVIEPLETPGSRRRVYYGYRSDTPFASGQYRTGWLTLPGETINPGAEARPVQLAFVLNSDSVVLPVVMPLQAVGRAVIVYAGEVAGPGGADVDRIPLEGGWMARVRTSQPIDSAGRPADLFPDAKIEAGAQPPSWDRFDPELDPALSTAIELARMPGRGVSRGDPLPATAPFRFDGRYPERELPTLGHRVLAAFRLYEVIGRFYPYSELLDEPWEQVLRESLPGFVEADTPLAYTLAVARMIERLDDSHAYVGSRLYYEHVGVSSPPVRVRVIEGRPVVAGYLDEVAALAAGVRIGDVVLEVDGEEAGARLRRLAALISASTPQSKLDKAALWLLNGPEGSVASVLLERADDTRRLRLRRAWRFAFNREREGEVVRILEGNIGYVDLDRLTGDQVDDMFEALRGTDGIVFDMRGYPLGTVWRIAPRLAERPGAPAARFYTPLVGHPEPGQSSQHFLQRIGPAPAGSWGYRGPTVMLVDERTQSQAEHTGLFLRAANGTRFVGSSTAGANGEITVIPLPGSMSVGFTGQAVEFADGTRLQRRGLQPDLEVRPTIAGLRNGRDEVLEAAVELLLETGR